MPRQTWRAVVLVGPMGAGKTTVGRSLAARLGVPFLDSDLALETGAVDDVAMTAAEREAREGTARLHAVEARALLAALARPGPAVIAAAASVVDDPACCTALADPAVRVAWLRADPSVLAARAAASDAGPRPWRGQEPAALLADLERQRASRYAAVADVVVETDGMDAAAVVERIVTALANPG